ncbi:MAG: nucleoside-diphosphate sugar epimerase [Gemmatales bacterium]|nr:MAG: nucleoside-diphosphate sugar epimerase [Gemmatales bacterium]
MLSLLLRQTNRFEAANPPSSRMIVLSWDFDRLSLERILVNVLLTGGYGCIGSWIVRNLLERDAQVWIYDLKEDLRRLRLLLDDHQLKQVKFICGDVTDLEALHTAILHNGISHIIHLAGLQVPVCRADPILGGKVNVLGTLAVFEAVRRTEGAIKRLVYASSAAVFSPPQAYPPGQVGNDVLLTPTTHYGVFKCCNEGNARIYWQDHGISSIGLRPWTVYGVGRDFGMTSEPTKAIKALALGRQYHISYGGWQDLQFVDDVAKTFIRCLTVPYQGARSYNLRGTVIDLPGFCKALAAVDPRAASLITHGDTQIPIAYDLDDSALQNDVGPLPKTPLEDGIRQTLELFRKLKEEGKLDTADLDC